MFIIAGQSRKHHARWWMAAGVAPTAAWSAIGATSQSASYADLAGSKTLYSEAEPTWSASTGWQFDGATQFLRTGVTPSSVATLCVKFSDGIATGTAYRWLAGAYSGSPSRWLMVAARNGGDSRYYAHGTAVYARGAALTSGCMCVAGGQGYLNGSTDGAAWTSGALPTCPVVIGAGNNNGTLIQYYWSGRIRSVAVWDTVLTAAQVAAVSEAMP